VPGWASSLISFLGCSVVVAPLCGHGERHEGTVVSPDGPGDAGQLVGESDGETQEAGEVTSRREAPDVSQESDQGGGDHQADARDRPQALDRGDLLGQGFELSLGQLDVVAEGLNLVAGRGQDVPESVRNAGVGVGDEG